MKKTITILSIKFFWKRKILKAIQASTFLLILSVLYASSIIAQDAKGKKEILKSTRVHKLQKLKSTYSIKRAELKKEAENIAKIKGWELTKIGVGGNFMELIRVDSKGNPMYYTTHNVGAAKTTRANTLHTGGSQGLNLNGEGITFGLWDAGGVDEQHQEWDNNITRPTLSFPSGHATHVAGTMVAKGVVPEAKGMASKAKIISYSWLNDAVQMADEAANGLLLSNHSYGWNGAFLELQEFGRYDDQAKVWDEIQYNAPYYLVVKSAGNDHLTGYNPTKNGYDLLNGAGNSKNSLVVAAVLEVTNYTGSGSVEIAEFSSWGPTDDGRIKPDISAKGVAVFSTLFGGAAAYATFSGTSMAAPNVTGSLGLVQQHYNNINGSYMRASTLKGLAISTAEETGAAPGPDYEYGWGLLNVEKAVQTISNNGVSSVVEELRLNNNSTYSTTVNSNGIQPLSVTIVWTDAPGTPVQGVDNQKAMLVNDLDVRVTKDGETFMPWKLDPANPSNVATKGDNLVDVIERINIDNTTEGSYVITVSHKGSLGSGQDFSLIITGASSGDPLVCETVIPGGLNVSNIGETIATASWNGVVSAPSYDVRYRLSGTSSWTILNASNAFVNITGLTASKQYQIQVRTNCPEASSAYSSTVTFNTAQLCVAHKPTGLSVSDIGWSTALVSINAVSLVSAYNYRYRKGSGNWTTISGASTSITLTGLTSESSYQVQANSECANGDISAYSSTVNFATTLPCSALTPENVNVTDVKETSVSVSWDFVPGSEEYYQIKYKPVDRAYFSHKIVINANNLQLVNLSEGTEYDLEIKAGFCIGGGTSLTTVTNFTTSGDGGSAGTSCDSAPQNLHTTAVGATTATVSWEPIDNGYITPTMYQIKYKPAGSYFKFKTSTATDLTLTGLIATTVYTVVIKAYCKGGASPSTELNFTTQGGTSAASLTSTNSSRFSSDFVIYPNPSRGNFTIKTKEKNIMVQSVTVYDMFGLKVFHKDYNRKINGEQLFVNLVKSGLYKIAITTNNSVKYETLLIEL